MCRNEQRITANCYAVRGRYVPKNRELFEGLAVPARLMNRYFRMLRHRLEKEVRREQ